jgi:hypothetical protein
MSTPEIHDSGAFPIYSPSDFFQIALTLGANSDFQAGKLVSDTSLTRFVDSMPLDGHITLEWNAIVADPNTIPDPVSPR